ncbi:MAG: hypothetical protein IPH81_09585 [Candidatus Microthrix sp.]|nr:hypothetical protein [Candidatus Microthrix sp.]MBK7165508.1 hypothetical protein [Candidatus Microthrix sp.]
MICERIADSLPEAVDGTDGLGPAERAHVETCLRCQAELVQYRKLLRAMHTLRTDVVEPAPGVLAELLASVGEVGEHQAIRSLINRRRVAYAGGIAAATAAGVTGAVVIAVRSRRSGQTAASA